jgi:hypothetical protein
MSTIVGLDFDNTLVTYDAVIHRAAVGQGLIPAATPVNKRLVRDCIRERPGGEIEWQRIQALVYGPLMPQAQLIDGAGDFIRRCRAASLPVFIVSHKTPFAGYDETGTNLRDAALQWMANAGFFDTGGLGFRRDDVFFESTRDEKIARIRALGCDVFVDDLEEVFLESSFPESVKKILYAPDEQSRERAGAVVAGSWQAVVTHVFDQPA